MFINNKLIPIKHNQQIINLPLFHPLLKLKIQKINLIKCQDLSSHRLMKYKSMKRMVSVKAFQHSLLHNLCLRRRITMMPVHSLLDRQVQSFTIHLKNPFSLLEHGSHLLVHRMSHQLMSKAHYVVIGVKLMSTHTSNLMEAVN